MDTVRLDASAETVDKGGLLDYELVAEGRRWRLVEFRWGEAWTVERVDIESVRFRREEDGQTVTVPLVQGEGEIEPGDRYQVVMSFQRQPEPAAG